MKIEKIELRHIKMELVSPFTTSMGTEYDEEHIIVRVDGEGSTGWGESVAEGTPFYSYETVTTALPVGVAVQIGVVLEATLTKL